MAVVNSRRCVPWQLLVTGVYVALQDIRRGGHIHRTYSRPLYYRTSSEDVSRALEDVMQEKLNAIVPDGNVGLTGSEYAQLVVDFFS